MRRKRLSIAGETIQPFNVCPGDLRVVPGGSHASPPAMQMAQRRHPLTFQADFAFESCLIADLFGFHNAVEAVNAEVVPALELDILQSFERAAGAQLGVHLWKGIRI
jgi:hypothetical protein